MAIVKQCKIVYLLKIFISKFEKIQVQEGVNSLPNEDMLAGKYSVFMICGGHSEHSWEFAFLTDMLLRITSLGTSIRNRIPLFGYTGPRKGIKCGSFGLAKAKLW